MAAFILVKVLSVVLTSLGRLEELPVCGETFTEAGQGEVWRWRVGWVGGWQGDGGVEMSDACEGIESSTTLAVILVYPQVGHQYCTITPPLKYLAVHTFFTYLPHPPTFFLSFVAYLTLFSCWLSIQLQLPRSDSPDSLR